MTFSSIVLYCPIHQDTVSLAQSLANTKSQILTYQSFPKGFHHANWKYALLYYYHHLLHCKLSKLLVLVFYF